VKESDAASMVQVHDGVIIAKFSLDKPVIRIGRDPDSEICIDDKVVSLEHAVVETVSDPNQPDSLRYFIRDLGSTNSTYVNDKVVTRQRLTNEDLIRIGWTTFRFVDTKERKGNKTLKIHKSWIPGVYYTED
jgi:pSer/pThr/pTyr-binding forkhead associated (FHA) protein